MLSITHIVQLAEWAWRSEAKRIPKRGRRCAGKPIHRASGTGRTIGFTTQVAAEASGSSRAWSAAAAGLTGGAGGERRHRPLAHPAGSRTASQGSSGVVRPRHAVRGLESAGGDDRAYKAKAGSKAVQGC